MKKEKLTQPIFIISVLLLVINDWFLKPTFHNLVTGKLSDFAGLFAFPFLISILFPRHKRNIHICTALLFVIWKSELVQPIIDFLNNMYIPVNRTIDFTDNVALIAVYFSYQVFDKPTVSSFQFRPHLAHLLIIVSCLSFVATSMPPRDKRKFVQIDKTYSFSFSKRDLISRLNMIQMQEVNSLNKFNGTIDFDSDANVFHYHGQKDTLAILLDPDKVADLDTIKLHTSMAEIKIMGNDRQSSLHLLSIYKLVPKASDKDYREAAVKQFEKRVVKKVKNYGHATYINQNNRP